MLYTVGKLFQNAQLISVHVHMNLTYCPLKYVLKDYYNIFSNSASVHRTLKVFYENYRL